MTLLKHLRSRKAMATVCGLTVAAAIALMPAKADELTKRTILTVTQTVQIGDAVLQPGQYVLKLLDSQTERHVVQIFNRDQTHIIDTVITANTERLKDSGHTTFAFYETPAGAARALRTWYYPGGSYGQLFIHPKHLEMLAANTAAIEMPMTADSEAPETSEPTTQAADNQPSPAQIDQQSADRQVPEPPATQTEVAQTAAPANDNASPGETPAQAASLTLPAELPQTGSPYPEIGMIGLMLVGLAGLSRLKRRA